MGVLHHREHRILAARSYNNVTRRENVSIYILCSVCYSLAAINDPATSGKFYCSKQLWAKANQI
jgi:hypothetical protein